MPMWTGTMWRIVPRCQRRAESIAHRPPLGLVGFAPRRGVTSDPEISGILGNVDSSRILNTALTLQNFRTRQSCSDQPEPGHGVTAARDFILNQHTSIPGLQVRLDPFVHPTCPNSPTFNVIAWLPGKHPNRLVIIGGHYDSRTTIVTDSTSDAPGGNDAGAQTGVVLELARVLAGHKFDSTIVFMSFSGEEQGLFGSSALRLFLDSCQPQPLFRGTEGDRDAEHGHSRRRQQCQHAC
jgi:Peptidase family M28